MFTTLKNYVNRKLNKRKMEQSGLLGSRKLRTDNPLVDAADRSKVLGIFMLLLLWVVCVMMLTMPSLSPDIGRLVLNQRAPKTIFAEFDFVYEDKKATEKLRAAAAEEVPLYFNLSKNAINTAEQNLQLFLKAIISRSNSLKNNNRLDPGDEFFANLVATLDENVHNTLLELIRNEQQLQNFTREFNLALSRGIFSREEKDSYKVGQNIRIVDSQGRDRLPRLAVSVPTPTEAAEQIVDAVLKYYSSGENRKALRAALIQCCVSIMGSKGTLKFNFEKTEAMRQEAASRTVPVMVEIKKHQPLITYNQIVTSEALERLDAYGEASEGRLRETGSGQRLFKNIIWSFILMVFIGIYMYHIHREIVRSNRKLALTGSVVIVCLIVNYLFIELFYFFSSFLGISPGLIHNAIPMALPAALLAVMLGFRVSIYVGFFVAAITAMMMNYSFELGMKGLVICCLAGITVRSATNYRSYFMRTLFIVFFSFWLLDFDSYWQAPAAPDVLVWTAGVAFMNALGTAIAALLLIFIFELLFGVSTNMSLFMLCDYNHPLLKRLQLEAPGTFHHSLTVATLAEYAAKAINANPIKARVGAIFHDIGKLVKPGYFVENNTGETDKHSDLRPRMSSLIILNHVKEGMDLALKYKLKRVIRDAIQQHHGTDIVLYFYKRALEDNKEKGIAVDESEYRYPGPLPVEKEVVIVSLADACEAASRSLQKPTPNKFEALVWEIFRKRIRDGQLSNAQITIAELALIRNSFVKTLTTMNHGRIEYPKDENENESDLFLEKSVTPAAKAEVDKKNGSKTCTDSRTAN